MTDKINTTCPHTVCDWSHGSCYCSHNGLPGPYGKENGLFPLRLTGAYMHPSDREEIVNDIHELILAISRLTALSPTSEVRVKKE